MPITKTKVNCCSKTLSRKKKKKYQEDMSYRKKHNVNSSSCRMRTKDDTSINLSLNSLCFNEQCTALFCKLLRNELIRAGRLGTMADAMEAEVRGCG